MGNGSFSYSVLALSVTFGATSPKGRGKSLTVPFLAPPLGELARQRLRGRAC